MDKTYGVLYDMVAANVKLPCSKEASVALLSMPTGYFDFSKIANLNLSKMEFVEALFAGLLDRGIDDAAKLAWEKRTGLPEKEFRQKAVDSVINSREFKDRSITVLNNIYSTPLASIPLVNEQQLGGEPPSKVKGFIKRVLKCIAKPFSPFLNNRLGNCLKSRLKKLLS